MSPTHCLRRLRPTVARSEVWAACVLAGAWLPAQAQQADVATPPAEAASAAAARLQPVIVTGTGFEQRAFDAPYSINVVDGETLRSGGPMVNLSEALARVPGLTINNRSNYAQDLQISSRGYGARSQFGVRGIRLYTDGIPATMPDGQGSVTHFDLAGAERIEVLRGPFSALYGNSSGGVIALFSAPARERNASLEYDVGSDGLRQSRATLQSPLGAGWDVKLLASRFDYDGFRPQSQAQRTLANIRLGWTGEQDRVVILANYLDQPAQDPLGLTRQQFDTEADQTTPQALQFNTRKDASQTQGGLQWRHLFAGWGALKESAVTLYSGHRAVTQWQSIPVATQTPPRQPGGVIDFARTYNGADGRLIWRWTLDGDRSAQFVAGAAYEDAGEDRRGYENFIGTGASQQLGVTGKLRRDERNTVRTRDAYAQGEFEFVKDWVATLGVRSGSVRFDAEDRFLSNGDDSGATRFSYTNPVAALQWRATSMLNLYVSAGRGFESPTLAELAYRPDGQSGFNAALRPQTSRQVELGAKWRDDAHGLGLDAAVFDANTSNEIGVASNTGGRSTYQNVGHTERRGLELASTWTLTPAWRTALAVTFLSAKYADDFTTCIAAPCNGAPANAANSAIVPSGNRIAGTNARSAFGELAWRPGGSERTELAAEWRAQGKTAVNDRNTDFAGGFATLALRASQKIPLGGSAGDIDVLARLDNATDRTYAGSVIVNEGNNRFFEPAAPRSVFLGVKWTLGW